MQAYKNDPRLKKDFLAEVERHRKADMIIKGTYSEGSGKNWRGCAVGCSIHSLNVLKGENYTTSDHGVLPQSPPYPRAATANSSWPSPQTL